MSTPKSVFHAVNLVLSGIVVTTAVSCGKGLNLNPTPSSDPTNQVETETRGFYRSGDQLLHLDQIDDSESLHTQGASSFIYYQSRLWPSGVLPVQFSSDIQPHERDMFRSACEDWARAAPVKCEYIQDGQELPRDYITVSKNEEFGCASEVGAYNGGGQNRMFLSSGCWNPGTIRHEIGHAFGLLHEHQRVDRDHYITINPTRFDHVYMENFKIIVGEEPKTPYDFNSIMHYGRWDFANSHLPVFEPLPPYRGRMPEHYAPAPSEISPLDAQAMTALYQEESRKPRESLLDPYTNAEFDRSSCPSQRAKVLTNALYIGMFFRKADFPGADGNCGIVHRDGPSGLAKVAEIFQQSREWQLKRDMKTREQIVANLYRTFFGRGIDESGYNTYVRGNLSYSTIINALILSPEFKNRYGY